MIRNVATSVDAPRKRAKILLPHYYWDALKGDEDLRRSLVGERMLCPLINTGKYFTLYDKDNFTPTDKFSGEIAEKLDGVPSNNIKLTTFAAMMKMAGSQVVSVTPPGIFAKEADDFTVGEKVYVVDNGQFDFRGVITMNISLHKITKIDPYQITTVYEVPGSTKEVPAFVTNTFHPNEVAQAISCLPFIIQ